MRRSPGWRSNDSGECRRDRDGRDRSTGRRIDIKARHFVLACGGLENARLLLASRDKHPTGIGNGYDRVGRYFMDHPRAVFGKVHLPAGVQVPMLRGRPLQRRKTAGRRGALGRDAEARGPAQSLRHVRAADVRVCGGEVPVVHPDHEGGAAARLRGQPLGLRPLARDEDPGHDLPVEPQGTDAALPCTARSWPRAMRFRGVRRRRRSWPCISASSRPIRPAA